MLRSINRISEAIVNISTIIEELSVLLYERGITFAAALWITDRRVSKCLAGLMPKDRKSGKPKPPALHAQPVRRAPRQKSPRSDDRPRPSALADAAGPRTTSASASLTRRRSTASSTRQPIQSKSAIRPSQAGGFRSPSVTQEWLILNHTKDSVCIT